MTFYDDGSTGDGKARFISDDARDIRLSLDTDDVDPEDVTPEVVERIVTALNREFYG